MTPARHTKAPINVEGMKPGMAQKEVGTRSLPLSSPAWLNSRIGIWYGFWDGDHMLFFPQKLYSGNGFFFIQLSAGKSADS